MSRKNSFLYYINMFSYYGSKSKIAHLYPAPKFRRIVEPFAGSARYSLLHWENEVLLCDLSEYVFEVWNYLLQASEKDILSLPDVPSKVSLDEYTSLSTAERYLIGFHLCRGKMKPRKVGHGQNGWARDKFRIAKDLHKIKHWRIVQGVFTSIPNHAATWFIDPPYKTVQEREGNSDRYKHWSIDYDDLAKFCLSRDGQIIVCEGEGADWLPFKLLTTVNANTNNSTVKKNGEYIYAQEAA
jgi:site-specific DNA-adenine methylase